MGRLFGTDGVRGIVNKDIDGIMAYKIGQAGAHVLTLAKHRPRILVGRDPRLSGNMLEAALSAGMCSVGAEVMLAGVVPTPSIAFLTRHYSADAGVVISASHNSVEYNGIKFFDNNGYKLPDELEERIEAIVLDGAEEVNCPVGVDIGRMTNVKNAAADYIAHIKKMVDTDLTGLKIAVDCANGASYQTAPELLRQLGAEVYAIYDRPDGTNINFRCGSTDPSNLQSFVLEIGADVGLAFDGDADRLLAVDEHGQIVDGDKIMVICARALKREKKLKKNTLVTTNMSNLGLDIALKQNGINSVKAKVGDRYVLEEMLKNGYTLGGEQSGHIIFLDVNTTGDGLLTAMHLLKEMQDSKEQLSELSKVMKTLPQVLVNARVNNDKKYTYNDDAEIRELIKEIELKFKDEGRVFIRTSGTEPLVRVMIEGKNQAVIEEYAVKLAKLIEEKLK